MVLLALGCGPDHAVVRLLDADPARDGAEGRLGPHGVAATWRRYPARVTEVVHTRVYWPVDVGGALAVTDAPGMLLVQGGRVAVERYDWLAAHLASRGYAVVAPDHPLDLAFFETGNALDAWTGAVDDADAPFAGLLSEDGPAAIGGHSLGGVVAAIDWVRDERFDALCLLASYPAAGTDVAARAGSPVLSIVGAEDGASRPATVREGFERFAEPRWYAEVDGLTHYGWTDGATEAEREGDGVPTRPEADARADAMAVVDTFLDAVLTLDPEAAARLEAGAFSGVEVSR